MFKTEKNFGGYWLKGLKKNKGRGGMPVFSATVTHNGKKVGTIEEDGWGGPARLYDFTPQEEQLLKQFAEDFTGNEFYDEAYHGFLCQIADVIEERRALKRHCKKSVCFFLKGEEYTTFRTMNVKWEGNEARVRAYLDDKYPGEYTILNEVV